jgi:hypothetical protein
MTSSSWLHGDFIGRPSHGVGARVPSTITLIACAIPAVIVEFAIILAGVPTPAAMVVAVILLIALLIALDAGNHAPDTVSESTDSADPERQVDATVGEPDESTSAAAASGAPTKQSADSVDAAADASTATIDQRGDSAKQRTGSADARHDAE